VKEETGVSARFKHLIAFRHAHAFAIGKSDLFFLTRLEVEDDSRWAGRRKRREGHGMIGPEGPGALHLFLLPYTPPLITFFFPLFPPPSCRSLFHVPFPP
jgi:hypothetical protein